MKKASENRSPEPPTEAALRASFDRQQKIMKMFTDNAKTYIQLSGAALALTVTFAHEILYIPKEIKVSLTDG
jgi:hypothetical protein